VKLKPGLGAFYVIELQSGSRIQRPTQAHCERVVLKGLKAISGQMKYCLLTSSWDTTLPALLVPLVWH